ncbi:hypothetical protein L6452_09649 [Arctium lappa]|uniref:Uncharacterized protein n=1 Tax=Arctium lappa TaxID=4217 RepID=A0ACB9DLH5_ARCLA|nr:hypothetical protein L6452_09649 [Arctium lappa]
MFDLNTIPSRIIFNIQQHLHQYFKQSLNKLRQLLNHLHQSDGELLGLNHQYLPKIVAVFAEVLSAGKDLASEQTVSRMINLLRQLSKHYRHLRLHQPFHLYNLNNSLHFNPSFLPFGGLVLVMVLVLHIEVVSYILSGFWRVESGVLWMNFDADIDESDDESIETITLGDKRIGIKTSVLEEKATACNMPCCYADEFKRLLQHWYHFLNFIFMKMLERLQFQLCRSFFVLQTMLDAFHKEPETEICSSMLDAINECLKICGPILDEGQVRSIVEEMKQVITASSARRNERADRVKAEDFDAEEGEMLKEENEQEEELFDQVGDCLGTLLKIFKGPFLPLFDELLPYLMPMWGKDVTAEEKRIAICIFDDVVEHCREAALKYYDTFLPLLLEACNDSSTDVRQAFMGLAYVRKALSRLDAVIRHPDALHPDNVMAYDNAVSALGKICQFHRDSINAAQIVPAWLNCLPIKGDLIEAKVVHDQLCSMVERSDGELLGFNHQYLPKIVAVFAEVLSAGKDLASEQMVSRMINLLRQLQQTLPPSALASTSTTACTSIHPFFLKIYLKGVSFPVGLLIIRSYS